MTEHMDAKEVEIAGLRSDSEELDRVHEALDLPYTMSPSDAIKHLRAENERLRAEVASKSEQIGKLYRVCNERDVLRAALSQVKARANSLQNADSHAECLRQFACIDLIAARALEQMGPSKEWCEAAAKREGDSEVGAGLIARDPEQKASKP